MQIVVSILPGEKQIILEVESSDSVLTVKEKIKDKEGIPSEEQQLFYSGKSLLDSDVLASHDIKNNDILVVHQMSVGLYRKKEVLMYMSWPDIPDIPTEILRECRRSVIKRPPCTIM